MCAATQSFGVVCVRRGGGSGLLGVFAVTTQGNAAESVRRGGGEVWGVGSRWAGCSVSGVVCGHLVGPVVRFRVWCEKMCGELI